MSISAPVTGPHTAVLRARDWSDVARRHSNEALGYVVDDLLEDDVCTSLHETLLSHWGWRHKDWTSEHLRNARVSSLAIVGRIAEGIARALPAVFDGWRLSDSWALLYVSAGAGRPHYDAEGLNVTYWLTPDRFNRRPGTGGLVLYSSPGRYKPQVVELADGFCRDHPEPDGPKQVIAYRRNRAVIFRATTLHRTDDVDFDGTDPHGYRMNLTLAFDRVADVASR